ncbi:hypothetical protein G9A89_010586 [Geosiphon pyriformis]|nr:hypothetical protein G9A89_010586 [Geosiphon pyriformis]
MERRNMSIKRDIADLKDIEGSIADTNQKITGSFEVVLAMLAAYQKENSIKIDRHKLTDPETSPEVKVLSRKADEEKKNLMSQVAILKKLKNCPYIIQFYGISEDENAILIITGWAELGTLTEYYETHGPIDWLKKVNRNRYYSILHHDIRSQNILIDQYHAAKIANFALSRNFADETLSTAPTLENVRYLAPEKLKDHHGTLYTTKCEIYSICLFGILLWEIAEEQIPHKSKEDLKEIYDEVLKAQSLPFSPSVPLDWQKISRGATRHEPSLRPSLTDMFGVLHRLLKSYQPQVFPRPSNMNTSNVPITLLTLNPNILDTDNDVGLMIESDLAELSTVLSVQDAILEHKKEDGNRIDAFKAFEIHASFGDQLAKYWMGYYLYYNILPQSPPQKKMDRMEKAAELFRKLQIKEKFLKLNFAMLSNIESAIKYFELAAHNDNLTAMYNLGYLYYKGSGVLKDQKKGKKYLILAALKGLSTAVEMCQKENISFTENLD